MTALKPLLKPVSFNRIKDKDMIDHIEALDENFASYVKGLIKKDMDKTTTEDKSEVAELVEVLKTMINNNNMMMGQMPMMMQMFNQMGQMPQQIANQPTAPEPEPVEQVTETQKKAVNSIMNKFKK